jgi:Uma2 family endonuclease
MRQPSAAIPTPLPFELVLEDGEPLESDWHSVEIPLLRQLIHHAMDEQERADFFVSGNIIYYSVQQAYEVWEEENRGRQRRAYRGPDVFWVGGVQPNWNRQAWIAWEEGGRLPDVIIELLSPWTAEMDRTEKKELYAQVFRTAEYFLYDPETHQLEGFRLADRSYRPIRPDARGHLWSGKLGAFLGLWQGRVENREVTWVRLFRRDGTLVPTPEERADAAEAEVLRLRALLAQRDRG